MVRNLQGPGASAARSAAVASYIGAGVVTDTVFIPDAIGFAALNIPLSFRVNDPGGDEAAVATASMTPEELFDSKSTARSAPANTYYVGAGGNDSNSGLTTSLKKLSWASAINAGNATNQPYKIVLDGIEYARNIGTSGVSPTRDIAVVVASGRAKTGIFDVFGTMTLDATYGACYSLTIGAVDRVLNRLNVNSYGDMVDFTLYATAAALQAATLTTDGYAYEGGKVYMRRLDAAVPTPTNTRLFRSAVKNFSVTAEVNVYIENLDLEGGQIGAFEYVRSVASSNERVVVAKNCTFKYGGGNVNVNGRSLTVDGIKGLAAFFNCTANAGKTDGFNFHDAQANGTFWLTVNCIGNDNGRGTSVSCNGLTAHEVCKGMDFAGQYLANHDGSVRHVNNTKSLQVCTMSTDLGQLGNPSVNGAFQIDGGGTAEMWCDRTKAPNASGKTAYLVTTTGKIHKRKVAATAGTSGGSGTIDTY